MDLQIQFRSYPTTPQKYLRIRSASQYTLNGRMDFAVELWSEDGTQLLAVARQMSIRVDAGKRMAKNKAKL